MVRPMRTPNPVTPVTAAHHPGAGRPIVCRPALLWALPLAWLFAACGDTSSVPPLHVDLVDPQNCEILDQSLCLLPFPSDRFTVADAATDTGLRVAFAATTLPANSRASALARR